MTGFLLWLLLLVFCWPLALAALLLYPLVWLLLLPFRVIGIAVGGVLALLRTLVFLPAIAERALERAPAQSESAFRSRRRAARPRSSSSSRSAAWRSWVRSCTGAWCARR